MHVAVDDRSRYACAEALPDERGPTTAGFLGRAIARFAGLGVKTERVLTDNGRAHGGASGGGRSRQAGRRINSMQTTPASAAAA